MLYFSFQRNIKILDIDIHKYRVFNQFIRLEVLRQKLCVFSYIIRDKYEVESFNHILNKKCFFN